MSDWQPDFDRLEVDLNDRDAQTSSPPKIWIFVDTTRVVSNDGNSKLLANLNLARAWLTENSPEGDAFDYEISNNSVPINVERLG
jgi:hypothetical protein